MKFVDEATHFTVVYFLKSKDQSLECFKNYVSFSERETNCKVKKLRSDNGGEYISKEWEEFCHQLGIRHSMGPPHSPEMNGTAERFNRTLLTRLLPTLFHANLPVRFWEDAAANAIMSINLSPSRTNPGKSSPFSLWKQQPASYTRLRTFGCKCIRLVAGPSHGGKLERKGNDCLYLRTLPDGDGWLVWDLKLKRTVKSQDVVFFEDLQPGVDSAKTRSRDWFDWFEHHTQSPVTSSSGRLRQLWERRLSNSIHNITKNLTDPDEDDSRYPPAASSEPPVHPQETPPSVHSGITAPPGEIDACSPTPTNAQSTPAVTPPPTSPSPPPASPPAPRRGQRQRKPPERYGFSAKTPIPSTTLGPDPQTFKDAMTSVDRDAWMTAMKKEMESLIEKDVFDLVPLPKRKKAIGCRWAYRTKPSDSLTPSQKKARLVAKGFLQRPGIDYQETYAPSTRPETVRFLLSQIVNEKWESCQMDIMTAFFNSLLTEEIYLRQPEGFVDAEHPDWVWRVKASLYGLKQAQREWNHTLTKELVSYGLEQSKNDPVLFIYKVSGKVLGALVVHVNDIILAGGQVFCRRHEIKTPGQVSNVKDRSSRHISLHTHPS